jgi:hypothetical protein
MNLGARFGELSMPGSASTKPASGRRKAIRQMARGRSETRPFALSFPERAHQSAAGARTVVFAVRSSS